MELSMELPQNKQAGKIRLKETTLGSGMNPSSCLCTKRQLKLCGWESDGDFIDSILCEFCGNEKEALGMVFTDALGRPIEFRFIPVFKECDCPESILHEKQKKLEQEKNEKHDLEQINLEIRKKRTEKLKDKSTMGKRFLTRTFGSFIPSDQTKKALLLAKGYCDK